MKKINFLILGLLLSLSVISQVNLSEKQLIGKWEPIDAVNVSGEERLNTFAEGFKVTKFEFQDDHIINLTSTSKEYIFTWFLASTKNAKWVIEEDTKLVRIGEQSKDNAISQLKAFKEEGKIFFLIEGIKIEMKKI